MIGWLLLCWFVLPLRHCLVPRLALHASLAHAPALLQLLEQECSGVGVKKCVTHMAVLQHPNHIQHPSQGPNQLQGNAAVPCTPAASTANAMHNGSKYSCYPSEGKWGLSGGKCLAHHSPTTSTRLAPVKRSLSDSTESVSRRVRTHGFSESTCSIPGYRMRM